MCWNYCKSANLLVVISSEIIGMLSSSRFSILIIHQSFAPAGTNPDLISNISVIVNFRTFNVKFVRNDNNKEILLLHEFVTHPFPEFRSE